jgi:CHAT domain-containing protein/tetratricopeptide (TPR) repeat protein
MTPALREAIALRESRRFTEAERAGWDLLARSITESGPASLQTAWLRLFLVETLNKAGRGGDPLALSLARQALASVEALAGPNDALAAVVLDEIATVMWGNGDFEGARPLFERALAIWQSDAGRDEENAAKTLNKLAGLAHEIGDYETARLLYERALEMRRRILGPTDPQVAASIDNLARIRLDIGDPQGARGLFEEALNLRERELGSRHREVAQAHDNLARCLLASADTAGARLHATRARQIWEQAMGQEHSEIAFPLTTLAEVCLAEGDPTAALSLARRAVELRRRGLGTAHPDVADALRLCARAARADGNRPAALAAALEAETIGRAHLSATLPTLPERQALIYAARRPSGLDIALDLVANQAGSFDVAAVWEARTKSRALVLQEMTRRHRLAHDQHGAVTVVRRLAEARQRLADLVALTLPASELRAQMMVARTEKEAAERALAAFVVSTQDTTEARAPGYAEIRTALPVRGALVAYVCYRGPDAPSREPDSYLAFVQPSAGVQPVAVPLGARAEIDSLVTAWRREIIWVSDKPGSVGAREASYRRCAARLRERVWDCLAELLTGAQTIFVVPDGALNLVSFPALPDRGGAYLLEKGPSITMLTAEGDLLTGPDRAEWGSGLLAVGAPDFGPPSLPSLSARAADERMIPLGDSVIPDYRRLSFAPLEGAAEEIQEIVAIWRAQVPNAGREGASAGAKILVGAAATEAAFREGAARKRVLHIATHGFYLPPDPQGLLAVPLQSVEDEPLLRSGLALAGANLWREAASGRDDGLLLAEEVATLDLSGVELVVLSACETGLGEIVDGEGILGLRRAIRIAGARSVVMTIWPIKDADACRWMRLFYERRLGRGLGSSEAARQASLLLLQERRALGLGGHPSAWGGFVAAGDWR